MSLFLIMPIVGLAIDGGRGYLVRLKLSTAVDGASLAAARLMGTGATATIQQANAVATATQFINANFPAGYFGAKLSTSGPSACVDPGTDTTDPCKLNSSGASITTYHVRSVQLSAQAIMPAMFMGFIGMPTLNVGSSGLAQRRDVRVMLVMDRSGSMGAYYTGINQTPPSINDLAIQFVSGFSGSGDLGGRDQLGLVVFGDSAIIAYPPRNVTQDYTNYATFTQPDNNFKLPGNVLTYLGDLKSGGDTNTAEALYLAYMALRADAATNTSLSTQLNVIVLFTDGLPNGYTVSANDWYQTQQSNKNFLLTSSTNCTDLGKGTNPVPLVSPTNNNMIGWISQSAKNGWSSLNSKDGVTGLGKLMMATPYSGYSGAGNDIDAYMQNPGGDSANIPQQVSGGCTGHISSAISSTYMPKLPLYDLYGNYTDLSQVPAVTGLTPSKPPLGPSNQPLYKLGTVYNNSSYCNGTAYTGLNTDGCQMGLAELATATHQAWKIWNQVIWDKSSQSNIVDPAPNMSNPVIFTIGFDHDPQTPVDMGLLQMIANDPSSSVSFSSRINGSAYRATTTDAVKAAFTSIASEILRLSR